MTFELTENAAQDLLAQAEERGEVLCQAKELGHYSRVLPQLGDGGNRVLNLRSGLTIEIIKSRLQQSIRVSRQHESRFPLVSKFYLSGTSRVQTPHASDIDNDYYEWANHHYLYHLPGQLEIEEWAAEELTDVVMISMDASYFQSFDLGNSTLVNPLQRLLQGDSRQRFHQSLGAITPIMQQLVQQIVQCPYSGLMAQLYLEGKALELLAAQFAIWTEAGTYTAAISLSAQDIEQLHYARDILQQQADQPPSLTELARQVGVNDRKLKQGFRQLFGTTVFGYLKNYRLEQAQLLLKNADFTIAQVALKVGYTNPEAFSTAFRRKFAISPKAYQLGQRS